MRFPTAVSLAVYPVFNMDVIPIYTGLHPYFSVAGLPPPAGGGLAPPNPMQPHLEVGWIPQLWPPGYALGKNKFTSNVLHRGLWFVLEGHDLGPLIPHVSIPPDNAHLIPTVAGASRKTKFTASEVRANGKGVACCNILPFPIGHIPSPMTFCSKPCALPMAGTGIAPVLSSAIVGQHWVDVVADMLALGVESLISVALGTSHPKQMSWSQGAGAALLDFVAGGDPSDPRGASRSALPGTAGNLTRGLVRLAGQEISDFRGPGGVNLGTNLGFADYGASLTRDYNSQGEERWAINARAQVGGDGRNVHGSLGASQNEAGDWQGDGALGVGVAGQNAEGRYSTHRPDDVGGGSGYYGATEGPLVPNQNFGGSPTAAPTGTATPDSLPEL